MSTQRLFVVFSLTFFLTSGCRSAGKSELNQAQTRKSKDSIIIQGDKPGDIEVRFQKKESKIFMTIVARKKDGKGWTIGDYYVPRYDESEYSYFDVYVQNTINNGEIVEELQSSDTLKSTDVITDIKENYYDQKARIFKVELDIRPSSLVLPTNLSETSRNVEKNKPFAKIVSCKFQGIDGRIQTYVFE